MNIRSVFCRFCNKEIAGSFVKMFCYGQTVGNKPRLKSKADSWPVCKGCAEESGVAEIQKLALSLQDADASAGGGHSKAAGQ